MKNIIILILFSIIMSPVSASEITGSISTNPNNLEPAMENPIAKSVKDAIVETRHASSLYHQSDGGVNIVETQDFASVPDDEISEEDVLVLGFSEFVDGSLVRGNDSGIYLINGEYKKHIKNLAELKKYSGQIIFDIDDRLLEKYRIRNYSNGDLIRVIGAEKIFHIVDGQLEHILNLEELGANFAGQEIFNIKKEEILLYHNF